MSRRGACYPMRTRQFVAVPAMRRDAEFPDDPKRNVLASGRTPPSFGRLLTAWLPEHLKGG
jgi:hypothetical protein